MAMRIRNRIEDYRLSFGRLSTRERMMVGGLGLVAVLLVVGVVGYVVISSLNVIEENNDRTRQAIKDMRRFGTSYIKQRQRVAALKVRMPSERSIELNSFVEKAAKKVDVKIAESEETTPVEGDEYVQRGLEIKLRKVTVKQVAELIKQLESSPQLVQITRLNVQSSWGQHETLTVEMVISTFEFREQRPEGPSEKKKKRKKGRRKRT